MPTFVVIDDAEVAPEAPVTTSLMTRLRDNALAYLGAPTGTRALFQQTAAPLGWTKSTTHNDKALRIVSGTAGDGGSTAFSTVFAARTITQGNLPNYNLSPAGLSVPLSNTPDPRTTTLDSINYQIGGTGLSNILISTGSTVTASITGTLSSGGSGTPMDFAVSYVDVIVAQKD